ncbi:MAG: AAA family ATPase, partial [Candidatus Rokubacteria bacterium]|nr:AAA family ATPase [Candidatus Rokubacteria bacterium]
MSGPDLLVTALDYHQRGWCPIPLRSRGKVENRKRPLLREWEPYQRSRPTEEEVRQWWRRWPDANVGLVTGAVSRMFALDLDGDADALLHANGITLPETPTSETGGGGRHVLFEHPGYPIPNGVKLLVGRATKGAKAPQVDVRGDGGYIVAPPSLHGSGRRYAWRIAPTAPLAPAPPGLLELIRDRARDQGAAERPPDSSWVVAALRGPVPEGQRNDTAARLAGHFLAKRYPEDEVAAVLELWARTACHPPMDLRELQTTVRSIARREHGRLEGCPGLRRAGGPQSDSIPPPRGGVGNESNFRPVSAAELLAREPEAVAWVWEPFLPEGGLALLAAFMKVGKSTFAYALAVAVAQGRPFLGYPTRQGGVLILAVEEHPRDVKLRLQRFGMRPEDPIYVHAAPLESTRVTLHTLREFVLERGVSLVLLDTLGRFWRVTDENANAEVVRQVSPLLDLARETGAAVLLIHHERKSGGEDGRGIRGGSALFGLVDQALLLDRGQGGAEPRRVLRTLGRYDETPRELILELDEDEYRLL